MDVLPLSQLQFAVTTVYHFFFVPLTLGLALFVAIVQTQYVRTGDEKYKQLTKFWGKLLVINFAMGVVTGIVQEFQFGMNWAEYSRFVGDIFGAPLAIEALAAFFVESVFLGVWIFGWDRLGKKMHLAAIWLVALAAMLSAYWILVANSFMQNPVGYRIAASGRAEMTDFFALITNPNVLLQFPHVLLGGLTTAGFFVMGISAYHLLRGKHRNLAGFRTSFRWAAWLAAVSVLVTMGFGHAQGQQMANTQPMKLAAAEGLWETEDPAGLSLFQIGDENDRESLINIRVPSLLSFLTFNTVDGQVQGINDLQAAYTAQYGEGDYVPPFIWLTYWSFRAMVGAGVAMFALAVAGLFLSYSNRLERWRWFLRLMIAAIFLPYLANTAGWLLTEVGRQPWIVQGLMTVDRGVSPAIGPEVVVISLIGFTLIYGALMIADIYLLQKYGRDPEGERPQEANAPSATSLSSAY